ncbi:hypothetical protein EN856_37085, partial [Mesorhizobium sp. M8A.F.Ca.ET.213.01.1.1]
EKRESAALGTEDVLVRAVTLVVSIARAFAEGRPFQAEGTPDAQGRKGATAFGFATAYLGSALPRLGREAIRRVGYRHAHWRVGYRFTDAPGVEMVARIRQDRPAGSEPACV